MEFLYVRQMAQTIVDKGGDYVMIVKAQSDVMCRKWGGELLHDVTVFRRTTDIQHEHIASPTAKNYQTTLLCMGR